MKPIQNRKTPGYKITSYGTLKSSKLYATVLRLNRIPIIVSSNSYQVGKMRTTVYRDTHFFFEHKIHVNFK